MSIVKSFTPKVAVATLEIRTSQMHIDTGTPGDYGYIASRTIVYKDANGNAVSAPPGAPTTYQFGERITPELLAAEPQLAATIGWISAFLDRRDAVLVP